MNPLHLADLPFPLPAGAPVVKTWNQPILPDDDPAEEFSARGIVIAHLPDDVAGARVWCYFFHDHVGMDIGFPPMLDLSPPGLDPSGWPLAVDGLTVATAMLARALDGDMAGGAMWLPLVDQRPIVDQRGAGGPSVVGWVLSTGRRRHHFYNCDYPGSFDRFLPALASINPLDPLADRLAMATVFRTRPWETR